MGELTLRDVADRVDDLSRALARQAVTLGELRPGPEAPGPDVPLLVELHALRVDALACAVTARAHRERDAFSAIAAGLERLLAGRGGTVVTPLIGDAFDARTMEAVEITPTVDPAADRTVTALLEPGLSVGSRSVRPARVAVHKLTPRAQQ
ncbi:MAG: nucleotide exchange factor GrpE [Pseudonocardia sp.]|nr:nucleotide exchange factor GrpE [Pseudonocardia sp.]